MLFAVLEFTDFAIIAAIVAVPAGGAAAARSLFGPADRDRLARVEQKLDSLLTNAGLNYYDVPFHAYQDMIISFAVVAYVCLFANAALHRSGVPAALVALGMTVLGLSAVNMSAALAAVLDGRSTFAYWLQTCLIAGYFAVLVGMHVAGRRPTDATAGP